MKSYLKPCIIRGLIAVLKMGAEKEAGWAVFANAKWRADSCVSIRLCSLNRGSHKRQNKPGWIRGENKVQSIYDANTGPWFLLSILSFWWFLEMPGQIRSWSHWQHFVLCPSKLHFEPGMRPPEVNQIQGKVLRGLIFNFITPNRIYSSDYLFKAK